MKRSIQTQLEQAETRFAEITLLLSDPEVMADQNRFRELSMEYAQLEPVIKTFREWQQQSDTVEESRQMLEEEDGELRQMAEEELESARSAMSELNEKLRLLMLPKDPDDGANVFLEIRAGTGGDEAALFSGDLLRMYLRYGESQRWNMQILSQSEGEHGGFKEVVARIEGEAVFSKLKFESGTHRVQRVPETETQGRIHTSACTVAILPEREQVDDVDINPADLRVDTYRSSGAGGQHVNTTDSAVRITHLPTGVVVECQDERSQHKNKARAMSLLQSRLLEAEQQKVQAEQARERKLQVGSGDRSQRIRTYNFPQGRVTDHRINLTLYKLDDIIQGALDQLIEPLTQEHQAELLAEMGEG